MLTVWWSFFLVIREALYYAFLLCSDFSGDLRGFGMHSKGQALWKSVVCAGVKIEVMEGLWDFFFIVCFASFLGEDRQLLVFLGERCLLSGFGISIYIYL